MYQFGLVADPFSKNIENLKFSALNVEMCKKYNKYLSSCTKVCIFYTTITLLFAAWRREDYCLRSFGPIRACPIEKGTLKNIWYPRVRNGQVKALVKGSLPTTEV